MSTTVFLTLPDFLNCKHLSCQNPEELSGWFWWSQSPDRGQEPWPSRLWSIPLGTLSISGSPPGPRRVSLLFLSKAFHNSTQHSFSFRCTVILCPYQYKSIPRVAVGFGVVTSDCPSGPRVPWRWVLLILVSLEPNMPGIECSVLWLLNEVRCGINMGWIRKLGGYWWPWSLQTKYSLGTACLWGFCWWWGRLGPIHKCLTGGLAQWNHTHVHSPSPALWLVCISPEEGSCLLIDLSWGSHFLQLVSCRHCMCW